MWSRRCKVSQRRKPDLRLCLESTNCLLDLVYFKQKIRSDKLKNSYVKMMHVCGFGTT